MLVQPGVSAAFSEATAGLAATCNSLIIVNTRTLPSYTYLCSSNVLKTKGVISVSVKFYLNSVLIIVLLSSCLSTSFQTLIQSFFPNLAYIIF